MKLGTLCVHAGEPEPRINGSAVMPIFQTSTFLIEGTENTYDDVRYTRCNNNPSQEVVSAKIAQLEGTSAALILASGMAAISSALLTVLKAGDHMLIQEAVYGGTHDLVHNICKNLNITSSVIDIAQPSHTWEKLVQKNTKVVYVEAISNPLIQVPDLPAVVAFSKHHGLTSIIDATFATPINLQPAVKPGFDIVIHSATKYLNGHSDLIAGGLTMLLEFCDGGSVLTLLCVAAGGVVGVVAGTKEMILKIRSTANHLGGSLDPHACFLLQRGIKTLALRVQRANDNAAALAAALENHPQVSAVNYPGLPSSPRFALVQELFTGGGAGGMLSFEVAGGVKVAEELMKHLKLCLIAPSLGGVETLVTRPATSSHAGLSPEERQGIGITDGLIRVAVGIEDTEDLVQDFMQALEAVTTTK